MFAPHFIPPGVSARYLEKSDAGEVTLREAYGAGDVPGEDCYRTRVHSSGSIPWYLTRSKAHGARPIANAGGYRAQRRRPYGRCFEQKTKWKAPPPDGRERSRIWGGGDIYGRRQRGGPMCFASAVIDNPLGQDLKSPEIRNALRRWLQQQLLHCLDFIDTAVRFRPSLVGTIPTEGFALCSHKRDESLVSSVVQEGDEVLLPVPPHGLERSFGKGSRVCLACKQTSQKLTSAASSSTPVTTPSLPPSSSPSSSTRPLVYCFCCFVVVSSRSEGGRTMLRLTSDHFPVFVPFGVIGFYRYLWYLIRIAASLTYRPVPLPENPTYIAEEDVTIIVPTIDAGEEFKEAAHSWLVGKPKEILIITEEKMLGPLQELANAVDPERIRVLTVPFANKRLQMSHGIKNTTTDIIVFADDDAIWPPTLLPYVLACFEDQKVGGVGTSQRVQPVGERMDGLGGPRRPSVSPSETSKLPAYRTVILKDPEFLHGFTHDYWLGKYQLNSGDDKFLTRWMVSHGWSTYVQCCKEAELLSTMKPNWRFLKQVLRWTRNTWRSDLRSLFMERHIWTAHPYVAYTMVDKLFNPFTLLAGPVLVAVVVYKSTKPVEDGGFHLPWWNVVISYIVWLFATRTAKLLPHLWYRPQDIIHVPAFILFGYYFSVMKIYALLTLHEVCSFVSAVLPKC
ncbi:hypothetical protein NUW54_g10392 [Trametes sanguinea]|uniref:Uncharacterized protein n=1 Tax=Trametes sanguinea TaxID=158606 RepID=A0ACC1P0Q0_9APHY|nr:hypothetical protein NUW54_g10392 [Trametes sanguinea]